LSTDALRIADRHHLEAVTVMVPVFAIGTLIAARAGRADEATRTANKVRVLLARLDGIAPRTRLLGSLLLAQAALVLDRRDEARALADEASRARRRDPTAVHLNEQLDALLDQLATGAQFRTGGAPSLSPAELRVLPYLATNLSLQDIAEQLFISRNTAKSHTTAIYRKLAVASRRDAVIEARRVGLLAG
jgi:LuxR family maltose regulon positive regulatory protein